MGEEEFKSLYDQMSARIYSFAARRLSPEAAKDVVGETFEVAWAKRHEWPDDLDARAGWVFTIGKNKILQEAQRVRRKHHDNRFAADYPARGATEPDVAGIVTEALVGYSIYAQLTEAEAELFDIAFMKDVERVEAAATLGLTITAFNTRVSRLRGRITSLCRADVSRGGQS